MGRGKAFHTHSSAVPCLCRCSRHRAACKAGKQAHACGQRQRLYVLCPCICRCLPACRALLEKVVSAPTSVERLLHLAAFAVSPYSSQSARENKPFNPLLGETFEWSDSSHRWGHRGSRGRGSGEGP